MKIPSLIKHTLNTGVVQFYEVIGEYLGGRDELGYVELKSLNFKNSVDSVPFTIKIPSNFISILLASNEIEIYIKTEHENKITVAKKRYGVIDEIKI